MRQILDFLERFNTLTGIAIMLGVPAGIFTSIGAFVWGRVENLRMSYILVLVLMVFGLTLWSWIGVIWLSDRARRPSVLEIPRPSLECAWGLVLENAIIRYDANGDVERQVAVAFRNLLSWPLRVEIISSFLEVENTTPDLKMEHPLTPFIVMPGVSMAFNFPGYSRGKLAEKERIRGKINVTAKYGHPDVGYTRKMSRWWHFEQAMKPNLPLFPPGLKMMPMAQVALNAGPYREDEDKAYSDQNP